VLDPTIAASKVRAAKGEVQVRGLQRPGVAEGAFESSDRERLAGRLATDCAEHLQVRAGAFG
jgi:hypothetical protein